MIEAIYTIEGIYMMDRYRSQGAEAKRQRFCQKMTKILKKRFSTFPSKEMVQRLPKNSQINNEILNCLRDPRNENTLMEELKSICDEILNVKKESENKKTNKDKRKNGELDSVDVLSQNNDQKVLMFGQQFYLYFVRLSDQVSKIKSDLKTFLCILLFEIGIFHHIRLNKEQESIIPFVSKCSKLNLIDLCICDDFGQTLFHFSAGLDNTELLNTLLTIDGDVTKYTNKLGKSAGDEALKNGQWSVVKQIALSKMGAKMKKQAQVEEKRIEIKRGIYHSFFFLVVVDFLLFTCTS